MYSDGVLIALTGTPGTGKSTIASDLRERGLRVVEVSDLAKERGMLREMDAERNSYNVDLDELKAAAGSFRDEGVVILVGHLAHLVCPDVAIVLRCRPSVLEKRLRSRGWGESKVRENLEAEAVDSVLIEALSTAGRVYEIDTSDRPRKDIVDAVLSIINGKTDKYAPGNIDWSDEVLKWY